MTQITTQLEEIADRISRTEFDDKTPEEKIEELNQTLESGDDIVWVLDEAIERLKKFDPEEDTK